MSNVSVAFIIPVRHFKNARNWLKVKENLLETLKSISNQTSDDWIAIVVVNRYSDLPLIPHKNIRYEFVDFDPNPHFERQNLDINVFHNAVKFDKGRRVLAGALAAGNADYLMVFDDDDLVNNCLVEYISNNTGVNGWYAETGYVWPDNSKIVFKIDRFYETCGSCFVIKKSLYNLPKRFSDASEEYIRNFMGSHMYIKGYLEEKSQPLLKLPFCSVIYRAGHTESHSQSSTVIQKYFINKRNLINPLNLIKKMLSIRYLSNSLAKNFRKL